MYRILKPDKDTVITNKIINNIRCTDANVGHAATLDLFRLYNETSITAETGTIDELSRILIHFNLDPIRELTGTILDFSTSTFRAYIKLYDVYGGQTTPSNFNVSVFALNKEFNEGTGRDIASFRDLDCANFLTASVTNYSSTLWSISGANHPTQDYISSTVRNQTFSTGEEDLEIDITNIISGTLAGIYPDYGFRISFSGTHETDDKTRFVKRFASRHANNPTKKPQLIVKFFDYMQDDIGTFNFGLTGSLFLYNTNYGRLTNIPNVSGSNCLLLEVVSGTNSNSYLSGTLILSQSVSGTSYTHRILSGTVVQLSGTLYRKYITGSQYSIGNNFISGVYFANFAIDSSETGSLLSEVRSSNSATFSAIWRNFSGDVSYMTSSLIVTNNGFVNSFRPDINILRVINNFGNYKSNEKIMFRIFAQRNIPQILRSSKTPLIRNSEIIKNMYYQIVDINTKKIIIPFDSNYTKVSTDSSGMYFNFYTSDLYPGLTYGIELKFEDQGVQIIYDYNKLGCVFTIDI